jgi:hypothetical protein
MEGASQTAKEPNHSAEELAALHDARLPGVLWLVQAEQKRRKIAEKDAQYDSLVDERRRNYETVQGLYPGKELAEEIRHWRGDGRSGR